MEHNDRSGTGEEPAPRLKRLWAALVDLMIVGVAMSPGIVLLLVGDNRRGETIGNVGGLGALTLQWSLICQTGQSFGKRVFGLRIVTVNGQPVDKISGVALRTYWVLALMEWKYGLLFCIADVVLIFGRARRCIHDYTAGTRVITVSRLPDRPSNMVLQPDDHLGRFAPSDARR